MTYIATFFSHFGAIRFRRLCQGRGWPATVMPVPRNLSSSCGSCVRYEAPESLSEIPQEVEQIVEVTANGYVCRYRAAES